jgi:SanA protein
LKYLPSLVRSLLGMVISPFCNRLVTTIRRHPLRWLICAGVVFLGVILGCDWHIARVADNAVYTSTHAIPETPVALLLGTAKTYQGYQNAFYTRRIHAAAELYHSGKVRGILISGDHGRPDYNEPEDMRRDLIQEGVPAEFITLDYAGFRTLDSIIRAKEVFGQSKLTIVSQKFHVERALYLADACDIQAIGYVADDPLSSTSRIRVRVRETLARVAAVFDTSVGRGPKFLGDAEYVALRSP